VKINNFFAKSDLFLIKSLLIREIESRYRGSMLGLGWNILTPLLMLLVFSFVFQEIFQAKWPNRVDGEDINFTYNLFIGLSTFWFFSDVIGRAPALFSSSPNYIKKVIFPLELLVLVLVLSSLFYFSINILIILGLSFIVGDGLSFSLLYLPLVIGVSLPLLYAFAMILASFGVYLKDVGMIVGVLLNLLMFLSPVFYPVESIPERLQFLFLMNPLTLIIEQLREIIVYGVKIDLSATFIYGIVALCFYFIAKKLFNVLKKGFADVL